MDESRRIDRIEISDTPTDIREFMQDINDGCTSFKGYCRK
jgi:hypothetical protein